MHVRVNDRSAGCFCLATMLVLSVCLHASGFASTKDAQPMNAPLRAPTQRAFGTLPDGHAVSLFTLEVPGGWRAEITDYGAILTRFHVPGGSESDAKPVDVVLGCDTLAGYLAGHPYFGATCGRVANRIAGGVFELDGTRYTLAKNNGANHLHGGLVGFDKKLWQATPRLSERGPAVDFEIVSPAGDEGYPGAVTARVTYTLTPDGELWVEMSATTDAPTIVNMVHHSYWNLAGHDAGTIRGHELAVTADAYVPVDASGIPTGALAPVAGTPFDLRPERRPVASLGAAIDALPPSADGTNPGGIDHNFVVRGWQPDGSLRSVAVLRDPASGRTLEILSDQPGIQVYTGNFLDGTVKGKDGVAYAKQAAICLETQKYPDAIHHPEWPSTRLDPGQTYRHTMVHRFGVR
jgi:aldose 1-epimerase